MVLFPCRIPLELLEECQLLGNQYHLLIGLGSLWLQELRRGHRSQVTLCSRMFPGFSRDTITWEFICLPWSSLGLACLAHHLWRQMLPWWLWWTFQSLFGGVKLKIDIFKNLLKAVVMPIADIPVLDSLLACGCFHTVPPVTGMESGSPDWRFHSMGCWG